MKNWIEILAALFPRLPGFCNLLDMVRQQRIQAWLVGGCLRDVWLERPVYDVDVALDGDCRAVGEHLAEQTGGSWFWLDRQRGQVRVLCPAEEGKTVTYDLVPLEGGSLASDLGRRDFTINAMALALPGFAPFFDPFGGLRDLKAGLLRMTGAEAIAADPLRVLRGLRFAHLLNLDVDPMTREILGRTAPMLQEIPGERLSAELARMLARPVTEKFLCAFGQIRPQEWLDIGGAPSGGPDRIRLDRLEKVLKKHAALNPLAESRIGSGFSAVALVRLYLLLCPADGEAGRALARRLKLSGMCRKALGSLKQICQVPPPPALSCRALKLWVSRLPGGPACGLLAWLTHPEQSVDDGFIEQMAACALNVLSQGAPKPLLSANQVGAVTGVHSGPLLGRLIEGLIAAEISGAVRDEADAVNWLKKQRDIGIDKGGRDA